MNRIILQLVAVGFCFALGQALQCYECKIGFWNVCITTKTTCNAGEKCYSGVGTAAGFVDVKRKGCLAVAQCNETSTETLPGDSNTTAYQMTKTCCDMDLCNGGPALQRPGVLGLALASVLALYAALH